MKIMVTWPWTKKWPLNKSSSSYVILFLMNEITDILIKIIEYKYAVATSTSSFVNRSPIVVNSSLNRSSLIRPGSITIYNSFTTVLRSKLSATRMWANAQRDGRPAEYRWRPLLNTTVWLTTTAQVPCSNAANIGEHKIWMQSEFCTCHKFR